MAVSSASSPPPPVSLLFFNGLIILAFLSIPFIALRILFLLPPLRPPPRPRRRPGGSSTATTGTNGATAAAAESLLQAGEQDHDSDDGNNVTDDDDDEEEEEGEEDRRRRDREPTRLLVVLGSGGHTAEMLAMLGKLDARTFLRSWSRRTYVVSEGDGFSAERAREFEEGLLESADRKNRRRRKGRKSEMKGGGGEEEEDKSGEPVMAEEGEEGEGEQKTDDEKTKDTDTDTTPVDPGTYTLHTVPRARAIHQSLLTTPLSALRCLRACLSIILLPYQDRTASSPNVAVAVATPPDLILTNGPGTGVVVVLAALLLRFADVGDARRTSRVRTVYVESWARVTRLSLSGRLLLRVVDRFVVQWEGLVARTGGKGEFLGVLV